jgi:PTS system nitrogen regulatory IIA component
MPYRTFTPDEAARYLHLTRADLDRLVRARDIPFEKRGDRLMFRKVEIDTWASRRILGLKGERLAEYHQKTSRDAYPALPSQAIMPDLIRPDFISPALPAKTKSSALREMTRLAEKTGRVPDPKGLLASLEAREALLSTGLPGGLALLHPRYPEPYLFDAPLVVLGRSVQEIPFGAPDGQPTRLFFLIGCTNDVLHLHTLARLCLMAQKTSLLDQLRLAADAEAIYQSIISAEQAVLPATPAG